MTASTANERIRAREFAGFNGDNFLYDIWIERIGAGAAGFG
jgi:hypothetical protein